MKKFSKIKNKLIEEIPLKFIKDDKKYIEYQFKMKMGEKLNLDNPTTYNEKINYFKLHKCDPLIEQCSDKIEVRKYIESKGLKDILTKLYKVYNSIEEINIDDLPDKFAIKTTHASGGVYIVKDKNNVNINDMKKVLRKSMKSNLYKKFKEIQYKNIKPRIMVEELIETNEPELLDYKIYCFHGEPKILHISKGIMSGNEDYCQDFYDINFNHLNIKKTKHKLYGPIPKPEKWNQMIEIAKKLSEDFEHVRVDLYCEKGKIYFGELTFTTAAGYGKFETKEMDEYMGSFWKIKK